jgi:hypothetical protein
MTRKAKPNKSNLLWITPLREWTSPWRAKLWFVGYVTKKATSLSNARRRPGISKSSSKSQQAKSPTPTSTRWKKGYYTIFDQEEKEWKCDSNQGQQASKQRKGGQTHLAPKEIISTMKSTKKVWIPREKWGVRRTSRNLETWQNWDVYHGMHHIGSSLLPSGLV